MSNRDSSVEHVLPRGGREARQTFLETLEAERLVRGLEVDQLSLRGNVLALERIAVGHQALLERRAAVAGVTVASRSRSSAHANRARAR